MGLMFVGVGVDASDPRSSGSNLLYTFTQQTPRNTMLFANNNDAAVEKKTQLKQRLHRLPCWLRHPLVQIFLPKLILEVFGAAGAIWGVSEAVGLRSSSTVWFWRPAALIVGGVFGVRWIVQVRRSLCRPEDTTARTMVAAADSITMMSSIHSPGSSASSKDEDETTALVTHSTSPMRNTSGKSIATAEHVYRTPTKKAGGYGLGKRIGAMETTTETTPFSSPLNTPPPPAAAANQNHTIGGCKNRLEF